MLNRLFKKIINTSIGKINLWLSVSGLFLSVFLILAAIQIRQNFKKLQKGGNQYLVITKRITNNMMGDLSKSTFSNAEIQDLARQPYFDSVQPVKTSLFKVKLDIPLNSLPLNTDLFFEAVPDAYLDVKPAGWDWKPGNNRVIGIAPRFLMDMYNYGFAIGQRLPQFSEESIRTVPLNFHLSNFDGSATVDFKGNIGGLSSRFGSILVPESFLDWANRFYGFKEVPAPARMVAKAKNPTSKAMNRYLKSKGWESDYGVGRFSKWSGVINFIEILLTSIGIALFIFSLLVFLMFIQLTITNAKAEIQLMHTLGVAPRQLRGFLMRQLMPYFGLAIGTALLIVAALQFFLLYNNKALMAEEIILPPLISWQVLAAALLIFSLLWWLNNRTAKNFIARNS